MNAVMTCDVFTDRDAERNAAVVIINDAAMEDPVFIVRVVT